VTWPSYNGRDDPYLEIDTLIVAGAGFRKDLCDFWDSVTK
jgi:hypothetical protein